MTSCGSEISHWGDLVQHIGSGIAQHALRADVEDLDDAFFVRGDAGEVGTVQDRVLQGTGFQEGVVVQSFGEAGGRVGIRRFVGGKGT